MSVIGTRVIGSKPPPGDMERPEATAANAHADLEDVKTAHGLSRLHYIDGMRAVAALWVVASHGLQPDNPLLRLPIVSVPARIILVNHVPVMVFLTLSGFCLYYPLALKTPALPALNVSYRDFIARRARRILPPFYAALGLCLLLIGVLPVMRVGGAHEQWRSAVPVSAGGVLSHLLLLHNLSPLFWKQIDYPSWSIGLEWQLYLFFPLFVWMFRRGHPLLTVAAALAVTLGTRAVAAHLPGAAGFALQNGPWALCIAFVLGMYAARCTVSGLHPRLPRWLLGTVCLAAFGIVFLRGMAGKGSGSFLLSPLGTLCLLLLAADSRSIIHRAFSQPWLVRMGVFSYSLYLIHAPLLHLFIDALDRTALSPVAGYGLLCAGAIPVIVGISYVFFLVFERPFIGRPRTKAPSPQTET